MAILKKGLSGEAVRRLQTKLGVTADTAKASRKHLGHHQGRIHVRDGPRRPQSGTSSTSGEVADCARASEQQQQSVGPFMQRPE